MIIRLTFFLVFCTTLLAAQSPYELKWKRETAYLGLGLAMTGFDLYQNAKVIQPLTLEEIAGLDRNSVNGFDRGATFNSSQRAKRGSDILQYISYTSSFLFLTGKEPRIQFNTIYHASGKRKYSDFTGETTTLTAGNNIPLVLTAGFSHQTYDEYFRVWIDYNQNNIFEEPTEIAFSGILSGVPNGTETGVLNGTINIPTDALVGTTRMRISMQRGTYADPCETFAIGEVEGYGLIFNPDLSGPRIRLINCPEDIIRTVHPHQGAGMYASWPTISATTSCQTGAVNIIQIGGPVSGSLFVTGTTTSIIHKITDECGNEEICTFDITVN